MNQRTDEFYVGLKKKLNKLQLSRFINWRLDKCSLSDAEDIIPCEQILQIIYAL